MKFNKIKLFRWPFFAFFIFALSFCEFHEIERGKYYRSQQLDLKQLTEAHSKAKIQTIINLRGYNPDKDWFQMEEKFAGDHDLQLINIAMSAKTIPTRKNLILLLDSFRDAKRPLLVHCQAGVDRTGEASAIYQMLYMGKTREEAMQMLTSKYGYVEGVSPPAKKYFIEKVWQGEKWAREEYDPCRQDYEYFDRKNCDALGNEVEIAPNPDDL